VAKTNKNPPIGRITGRPVGSTEQRPNYDKMPPNFSFEKMSVGSAHNVQNCDEGNRAALASKLFELTQLNWVDITLSHKKGMGSERIPRTEIKVPIPPSITPDLEEFLSIRYNGKRPMVGYRDERVFHIVFLDHNFKVYDHGS
jgi:hypothetical protein